jgi:membrane associated rhomboid family serine protease
MGIYDRDYTQAGGRGSSGGFGGGVRFGLPKLTSAVKWLLIINIAIFLVEAISGQMDKGRGNYFEMWGAVFPLSWAWIAQVWRLVTYQFLHANLMHVAFNMLALYMFGGRLESYWGARKFTIFYLSCGAAAGLLFTGLVLTGAMGALPLVGASAAILGVLAACAILFPHDIMLFYFFPLPMWVAAILFAAMYVYDILTGQPNAGGNVAHLGGMAAGAAYCWLGPKLGWMMTRRRRSAWDKKMDQQRRLQIEVDRILDKVSEKGIGSLSRSEKKLLQEATRLEQERTRPGSRV